MQSLASKKVTVVFQDGDVERCLFINRAADSPSRQQRPILHCGERVGTSGGDEMGGRVGGGGIVAVVSSATLQPPPPPSHGRCQRQQKPATKCRVIQHVGGVARKRSTTTRRPQRRSEVVLKSAAGEVECVCSVVVIICQGSVS